MKIDIHGTFTDPVEDIWLHTVFYYKYNGISFFKFPIDLWENVCSWLNGTSRSYIMDWTYGRVMNYSNLNHPCPFIGLAYLKIDNISVANFPLEPLMPSGEYRVDVNITENKSVLLF